MSVEDNGFFLASTCYLGAGVLVSSYCGTSVASWYTVWSESLERVPVARVWISVPAESLGGVVEEAVGMAFDDIPPEEARRLARRIAEVAAARSIPGNAVETLYSRRVDGPRKEVYVVYARARPQWAHYLVTRSLGPQGADRSGGGPPAFYTL